MKTLTKCLAVILLFTVISSVGLAFADWDYALHNVDEDAVFLSVSLLEFLYTPEEVLPDDDYADIGEDHLSLIDRILNAEDYGLNETKKPIMHNVLASSGIVFCDQNVQGGNLKHVMIDGVSESERLYFVLERVSDTEYLAYTMRYYDIRDYSIGTEIEVYMTVLEEGSDGVWTATRSYQGYARVNDPSIVSRAIDVTTWREK